MSSLTVPRGWVIHFIVPEQHYEYIKFSALLRSSFFLVQHMMFHSSTATQLLLWSHPLHNSKIYLGSPSPIPCISLVQTSIQPKISEKKEATGPTNPVQVSALSLTFLVTLGWLHLPKFLGSPYAEEEYSYKIGIPFLKTLQSSVLFYFLFSFFSLFQKDVSIKTQLT